MAKRTGLTDPPIEALLDRVDSKFTLVSVAARRARQINSYYQGLGDNLGAMIPPQVASVSSKPLSVALEEIVADKIAHERTGTSAAAAAVAAVDKLWIAGHAARCRIGIGNLRGACRQRIAGVRRVAGR